MFPELLPTSGRAKYAITPQLDVTGAYYYLQQSNFNTTACTGITSTFTQPDGNKQHRNRSSSKCAGMEDAFSALMTGGRSSASTFTPV